MESPLPWINLVGWLAAMSWVMADRARWRREAAGLDRRLKVVESILGCKGLLPDDPREIERGVERLTVLHPCDQED
jgi:hypothetical protein